LAKIEQKVREISCMETCMHFSAHFGC
jgi:hypothetical protein